MLALAMVQLPLVAVVHPTELPPEVKLPLTTAPGTAAPLESLIVTLTVARHPLRTFAPLPVKALTETWIAVEGGGGGDVAVLV